MPDRGIWEERLFVSNRPLPKRKITKDHPIYGLPTQYIVDGQVLTPWTLWALVDPIPREWLPLPQDHEAAYLTPPSAQIVRVGLIDYAEGTVVAWRRTHGSTAYRPRPERTPR